MKRFEKQSEYKFRAFEVEGKRLWVSPGQLADQSKVFTRMFFGGGFGDSEKEVIPLPGKTLEEFVPFLTLLTVPIYDLGNAEERMKDSFLSVWRLAHEYGVEGLEKYAENYITTSRKCPLSRAYVDPRFVGRRSEVEAARLGLDAWELAVQIKSGAVETCARKYIVIKVLPRLKSSINYVLGKMASGNTQRESVLMPLLDILAAAQRHQASDVLELIDGMLKGCQWLFSNSQPPSLESMVFFHSWCVKYELETVRQSFVGIVFGSLNMRNRVVRSQCCELEGGLTLYEDIKMAEIGAIELEKLASDQKYMEEMEKSERKYLAEKTEFEERITQLKDELVSEK